MPSPRVSNSVLHEPPPTGPARRPAVVLSGLTRVFGVTPALVRVSLSVDVGEVVLVRGPNGAGKSTLLRVVATAVSPTFGTGSVLGFDLLRERDEIRARVELLGHRTRLYEDLTAAENLRFACRLYGIDRSRIPAALERVGLRDVAGERVRELSQGMRQRVAVARAVLRRPELLLLDEPYAGLDAEARDVVDAVVAEARLEGRTVLLATHQPSSAMLATRSVFMDRGRVLPETGDRPAAHPAPEARS